MGNYKITSERVMKDYEKLKKISREYYLKDKMKNTIDSISLLAKLMYSFNIKYSDNEVEELLKQVSKKIFKRYSKKNNQVREEKKIIFYDYFSLDNRGLTEQYLQGLIDLNYEILFITLQKNENKMRNILKKLSKCKKSEVYIVKSQDQIQMCYEIRKKASSYGASKIFIHTAPWDIVGLVTWVAFKGETERYLVNLTDHTFWLGKCCSDYYIEFRSYGKNISIDNRGITEDKLSILPYYPIRNCNEVFQGFPFDNENKKIIFSGGSLYKIYGSPIFFEIVKHILDNYEDTIFLFLGNGNEKPLKKFISKNRYERRFYFYNERKDINEIFKRCYFYLGTYPICGGLMSQFAIANGKLAVAYTSKDLPVNLIEELFIECKNKKFTYTDVQELKNEIDKLIKNENYLIEQTSGIKKLIISQNDFSEELEKLIKTKKTRFEFEKYEIDINKFSNLYFEQENKYLFRYKKLFLTKNLNLGLKFYKYFIPSTVEYIISKFKGKFKK